MQFDTLSLLFFAALFIAIGYILSILLRDLRSEPPEKPKVSQTPAGILLQRDLDSGQYLVTMDDHTYHSAAEMRAEQQILFQNTLKELNSWFGEPAPADLTDAAVAEAPTAPVPLPVPVPDQQIDQTLDINLKKQSLPKFSMNPVNILMRAIETDVPKLEQEQKSIIAQVDEILQAKIKNTPFAQRSIRLMENFDHTMLIQVGMEKYTGIDTIPDEEIRNLIRQAVAEWTGRQGK